MAGTPFGYEVRDFTPLIGPFYYALRTSAVDRGEHPAADRKIRAYALAGINGIFIGAAAAAPSLYGSLAQSLDALLK